MSHQPTLINLPPAPSDPITPSDIPSRSGTPNSTTTSMSELSTVAIKDGHRGHLPHHSDPLAPRSVATNTLDAERADRISRLAGLERVTTARNLTPTGNLTPGATAGPMPGMSYFDNLGNPVMGRERSTVGSASATGSVGGHTTWAGSEAGDADKMSESQDMDMDTSSVGGMSEEGTGSLVGFGEGARTPARQSQLGTPAAGKATPTGRDSRMMDGVNYDNGLADNGPGRQLSGAETAERIVRENMDISSADRMMQNSGSSARGADLGKFAFEK